MSTATETTTVPHDGAVNDMGPLRHIYPGGRPLALCGHRHGPGDPPIEGKLYLPGMNIRVCAQCKDAGDRWWGAR